MTLGINPTFSTEETRKDDYGFHPIGYEVVDLAGNYEDTALDTIDGIQNDIQSISDDLFAIMDLLTELRKAKEQGGDHVNVSHLESKIRHFQEIWEKCAERYPIVRADDDPFGGKNLSSVSKKDLEWVEMGMRNLESKHQGQIQTLMTNLETAITAQKMIFEIFVQIAKAVRESQGYWTKKQTS